MSFLFKESFRMAGGKYFLCFADYGQGLWTMEIFHRQRSIVYRPRKARRYNSLMLPDLQMKDHLRLRKPHPCGSYEWTVVRLGADIGLECKGCQHRVMLTRRELAKRMKTNLTQQERERSQQESNSDPEGLKDL
jgi:hypothetical protein